MKKTIYISLKVAVALLASALVSCTKIERVNDEQAQEIAINPLESVVTKSQDSYPIDGIFGVYAYHTSQPGGTAWRAAFPGSVSYFDNAAFKYSDFDGDAQGQAFARGWNISSQTDNPYYWPFAGSLMFAGYSPHKEDSNGAISSVNFVPNTTDVNPYMEIGFTQNTKPSEMVDLLWFDVKDVAEGKTIAKSGNAVNVVFKHALSNVTIKFSDNSHYYKLASAHLRNCINKATFYTGNTAGWLPDIKALADYDFFTKPLEEGKETYPLLDGWTDSRMYIIPQYLDGIYPTLGGTVDLEVDVILEFTLTDGFSNQTVEIPLKNYTEKWEMGKHYIYNVVVNADPIDFGSPVISINTKVVSM